MAVLAPACSSAKRTIAGVWPGVAPPAAPVAAAVGGELACTPGELAASAAASMVWSAAARSAAAGVAAGVAAGEVGCAIGGQRPLPPFRLPEPLTTAVTKPSSFSGVASKLGQSLRGHAAHLLSHRGRCGAGGQQGRAYLMLVATSAGSVTSRCSSSSNGTTATRTRSGISYTSVSCSQLWYTTLSCLTVSSSAALSEASWVRGLGLGLGLG